MCYVHCDALPFALFAGLCSLSLFAGSPWTWPSRSWSSSCTISDSELTRDDRLKYEAMEPNDFVLDRVLLALLYSFAWWYDAWSPSHIYSTSMCQCPASRPKRCHDSERLSSGFLTMTKKLTKKEKRAFQNKLDSIKVRTYGSSSNHCKRAKHPTKPHWINGKRYTAAQLSWIVGTGCHLPADGFDIDHICADPKWNGKCCKCITFAHLRRKDRAFNISRQPCHHVIRKFMEKLFPILRKDPDFKLVHPGPVYVKDVLPYISELYVAVHYQRTKAWVPNEQEAKEEAEKKEDWISRHSICSSQHSDDPCMMCYGSLHPQS